MLVEAHRGGDGHAFEQIVRAHDQALFAHAVSRLGDVQAAEDAVQETFVRAYRALPHFSGDFHLRAWLHRILTNVCHDEGSRRQRDSLLFQRVSSREVGGAEPADVDIERLDVSRDAVARALGQLSESYREALVLRYVDELSYEEVAAATGVTEGNARVRVMRGRLALKRAMTSSHAVVLGLLPWLRRAGRGPAGVPELHGAGAASITASTAGSPGMLASAPNLVTSASLLLPATDAAPMVVERMATLPQVIGLVASLALPIAAPAVGDHVVGWVTRPPAAAAPAVAVASGTTSPVQPAAPSAPVPKPPQGSGASSASTLGRTGPAAASGAEVPPTRAPDAAPAEPTALAPATAGVPVPGTSAPPTTTTTTAAPTTTTTLPQRRAAALPGPGTALVEPAAPGGHVQPDEPEEVPAPPVSFTASLLADQLTSAWTTPDRLDLAGVVAWAAGRGAATGLDLRGSLDLRPGSASEGTPDAPAEGSLDGAAGEAVPSPPIGAPGPRPLSGDLSLSTEDGRPYRLVLTDGLLAPAEVGSSLSGSFELRDPCGVLVAAGTITGELHERTGPPRSSLVLLLHGEGPAAVAPCG